MKKVNKKLASAIVLGLMMAVPFSASASGIYPDSQSKDFGTDNVTLTGEGAYQAFLVHQGNTADITGTGAISIANGTGWNGVFYINDAEHPDYLAEENNTMNIKGFSSISNSDKLNSRVFWIHGGHMNVETVNGIVLDGVYTGVDSRTVSWSKEGVSEVNITTTTASDEETFNGSVVIKAEEEAVGAGNHQVEGTASVNITSAKDIYLSSEDDYVIKSYSGEYVNDDTTNFSGYAGKTEVELNADNGIITIAGDSAGAIFATNGAEKDAAKVVLNGNYVNVVGDIIADKNAYVGVNATTSAYINSDIVATDSNVDFNLGNGSFTGAIDNTGSTVNVTGGEGSSAVFGSSVAGDGATAVRADQGGTVKIDVDNISVEAGERTYTNVFMAIQDTVVSEDSEKRANITINADNITGKYDTAQAMNVFKAWGGDIDVIAGNIYFDNVDVGFAAETFQGAGADLTVNANNIYMSTVGGEAVHARFDSTGETKANTTLNATGYITLISDKTDNRATVSVYQNDKNDIANSDSSVSLTADGTLTIENKVENGNAIYVENAEGDKVTSVTAKGANVVINGNIEATDNTSVVVGNDDYSSVINFTGAINDSNDYDKVNEGVTFNMKNGSVWNVTGNSRVRSIDGVGTIKLDVSDTEAMDTVEIDNAKDADLTIAAQQNADDVKDANAALEAMAGAVDGVNDGTVVKVEEGILKGETSGTLVTGENGNSVADVHQNDTTTTMGNMRDLASVALVAWRQEDSTLSQRLGELRNSEGDQGIWARMSRGEFEYDGAFKNQYNYFQMGYDWAADDWHYGAAISHNDGQTTYANGNGENDSTSLTLYGTWLGDKGQYTDIVVKHGKLNNEFTNYAEAGVTKADYDMWGTSISAEYGQKLEMKNDWYVTPQAQLTYMVIGSEDYTATVDGAPMQVSQDSMDSVVGRVGFEAGKHISDKGSIYAKASLLHEFAGEADTYMQLGETTNSYTQDLGDTWYECGIGVNYKTSDNSYVYADVVKTFGGDVETPWQWNAGMRFTF